MRSFGGGALLAGGLLAGWLLTEHIPALTSRRLTLRSHVGVLNPLLLRE